MGKVLSQIPSLQTSGSSHCSKLFQELGAVLPSSRVPGSRGSGARGVGARRDAGAAPVGPALAVWGSGSVFTTPGSGLKLASVSLRSWR